MSILGAIKAVFSSGVMGSVEKIALEKIDTVKETAEAGALFVKTLDPNGLMRRELSRFASRAYGWYLCVALILILVKAFELGDVNGTTEAITAIKELFLPITTAWGTIVTASFGVNVTNVIKGN